MRRLLVLSAIVVAAGACECGAPVMAPDKGSARTELCVPRFGGEATVLATGLDGPRKLAADGTALYVSVQGGTASGSIRRTALDRADAGSVLLADGLDAPDALAVDQSFVYFTTESGLWRVGKDGGTKERLVDLATNALGGETSILVDGEYLIVATGLEWLARVRRNGHELSLLHTAPPGSAVKSAVLEAGQVYFLVSTQTPDAGGIHRVASTGGPSAQLYPTPVLGRALALSGDHFFWTEGTSLEFGGEVRSRPRLFADAGTLVHAERQWAPGAIAVDRPYVFFAARTQPSPSNPPSPHFLLRGSARCDDGGITALGPKGHGPGGLLLHDGGLYFTSRGVLGQGWVGRLP